jgi:hypothetical protein
MEADSTVVNHILVTQVEKGISQAHQACIDHANSLILPMTT